MSAADTSRGSVADRVAYLASGRAFHPADRPVTVVETHTSWVFMGHSRVLKMKKPIRLDFLDFRALASRRRNAITETRLNRRLAPGVYRDPVALRLAPEGRLTLTEPGEVVDWLVDMHRLPHADMLDQRIRNNRLEKADVVRLGRHLARFYAGLKPPADAELYLRHLDVEQQVNQRILLDPRLSLDPDRMRALFQRFETLFADGIPLIRARIAQGRIVEGHGDLRPCHVCLVEPPVVFDCLEFDRSMRLIDPFDELTFLGLECAMLGVRWVRDLLVDQVSEALGERPEPRLIHVYGAFRAILRARLCAAHLLEEAKRDEARWQRLTKRYLTAAGREITAAREAGARSSHLHGGA